MGLKVITANRLRQGDVVYLTADGGWSGRLCDGATVETDDQENAALAVAEGAVAERHVIDPYAMAVARVDGEIRPLGQREIIRSLGPSVRPDLGKQAIAGGAADV